jgi:hypothetical protein
MDLFIQKTVTNKDIDCWLVRDRNNSNRILSKSWSEYDAVYSMHSLRTERELIKNDRE